MMYIQNQLQPNQRFNEPSAEFAKAGLKAVQYLGADLVAGVFATGILTAKTLKRRHVAAGA